MGGSTTGATTTGSTASSDPQVTSTLNQLLGGLSSAYTAGPTYVAPGSTTTGSWQNALNAANNPAYASGVKGALGQTDSLINSGGLNSTEQGALGSNNALASQYGAMANNPGSTQAGQNLINSVLTSTNSAFNNSGLFGSQNNGTADTLGLTQGLGNLQQGYLSGEGSALQNSFNMGQQGAANEAGLAQLLPSLYSASQLPSGTQSAVGSAQDAAAQAGANKNITLLGQLSSILQGTAPAGGTTTSTSTATPLYQTLLSGLGALL